MLSVYIGYVAIYLYIQLQFLTLSMCVSSAWVKHTVGSDVILLILTSVYTHSAVIMCHIYETSFSHVTAMSKCTDINLACMLPLYGCLRLHTLLGFRIIAYSNVIYNKRCHVKFA